MRDFRITAEILSIPLGSFLFSPPFAKPNVKKSVHSFFTFGHQHSIKGILLKFNH